MRNNNLIHINNLDGEIRDLLLSVNPNTATIEALLSHYFDKDNDKILISNIDTSVVRTFNDYADDNDKVLLNEINKCRLRNDPIKRSDLDSELLQTIENNTLSIAAIGGLLKSTGGGQIDISALSNEINTLKHTINDSNFATKDDIETAKQEVLNESNDAINNSSTIFDTSITSIREDIGKINTQINTMHTNIMMIENDVDAYKKSIESINNNINNIAKKIKTNKTNALIKANDTFIINTLDPFSYDIKIFVYDDNTESNTYQQYIDASAFCVVSYQYKKPEEDIDDNTTTTAESKPEETKYKIIITNITDKDINVKIVYRTSLNEKIESNIINK